MDTLMFNHNNLIKYYPLIYFLTIIGFLIFGWLYGKYRLRKSKMIFISEPLMTAIFGLSALVLGFTFANAAQHYDHRINIIREEASSISKLSISAQYLNSRDYTNIQNLLREVLDSRLNVYRNVKTSEEINNKLEVLNTLLDELNKETTNAIQNLPANKKEVANQILRPELNNLLSAFQEGIHNSLHHPPEVIELFLYVLLAITSLLGGYSMAIEKKEDWFLTTIYLGLIGFAVYVIFALSYPNEILSFNSIDSDLIRLERSLPKNKSP